MESYCIPVFAGVMEVIPPTLAETAGLNLISLVTILRNWDAQGEKIAGTNFKKGDISNFWGEPVV